MNLRERFAELRAEELRGVPPYRGGTPRRQPAGRRRAAFAFALVLIVCVVLSVRPRRTSFTAEDRAAAQAIATWHPPTDFLLRMPSTGVSR